MALTAALYGCVGVGASGCARDPVPVEAADTVPADAEPGCVQGERRCEDDVLYKCLAGAWEQLQNCASQDEVCADASVGCQDPCAVGGAEVCPAVGLSECGPEALGLRTCMAAPGGCLRWSEVSPCDDGDPCTADLCAAGACATGEDLCTCDTADDCADPGPCQIASCDGGKCANTASQNATSCALGEAPACAAGFCFDGVCEAFGRPGTCLADGQCYGDGDLQPQNPCASCQPTRSTAGWSPVAAGAPCGADGLQCTADTCDGSGVCAHPVLPDACLVDGACLLPGEAVPDNPCRICDPDASTTSASDAPNATVCELDGKVCTEETCFSGLCGIPSLKPGYCNIQPVNQGPGCVAAGEVKVDDPCFRCAPDAALDQWTNGCTCPGAMEGGVLPTGAVGVWLAGESHVLGGTQTAGDQASDNHFVLNPFDGESGNGPLLPAPRLDHQAIRVGEVVYLFGGVDGSGTPQAGTWALTDGQWVPWGAMSGPRHRFAAAAWGGALFAYGGIGTATWERLDLSTTHWETQGDLGDVAVQEGAAVPLPDGILLVAGGDGGPGAAAWWHLPDEKVFEPAPTLPQAIAAPRLAAWAGAAFAIGGHDSGDVYRLDPGADHWETMPDMLAHPRSGHALVGAGSVIFVFGGVDGTGEIVDDVECLAL